MKSMVSMSKSVWSMYIGKSKFIKPLSIILKGQYSTKHFPIYWWNPSALWAGALARDAGICNVECTARSSNFYCAKTESFFIYYRRRHGMFDSIFFWRRCEKPEANPIFSYLTLSRVFQFPAIIPSDTGIMITRERCIAFIGYARNAKMHVNKYINKRRYTQRLKSLCERDYENIFQ